MSQIVPPPASRPDQRTVVIVGAGIMGLCSAWALTRAGHRVTLLDQGPIPNPVSSSYDEHRIIRHAYGSMRGYARMIPEAFASWQALWADLGQTHFAAAPATYCLRLDTDWYEHVSAYLGEMGIGFRDIALGAVASRLPMLATEGLKRVVETEGAGVLFAQRIVEDMARWLEAAGATLVPHARIEHVDPERGLAMAGSRQFQGDCVVVTAGAWASRLLPDLAGAPVPSVQTVAYLQPPADLAEAWAGAPVLLARLANTSGGAYILPPRLGTRLKIGDYAHPMIGDPDEPRRPRQEHIDNLLESARQILAGFDRYRLIETKACFYAVTEDENFILRKLGECGWVLSACSGHGFKFGALMGRGVAAALDSRLSPEDAGLWAAGKLGHSLPPAN